MLNIQPSRNSHLQILIRSIAISLGLLSALILSASAEITATTEAGTTGTKFTVTPNPTTKTTTIDIEGGQKSSDNKNLFHSFGKFNVDLGQVANFKADEKIGNILGTVTGGASSIDGKLQVTGGDPKGVNLYLMNPAGIVFGKGASLDINGAFTATTAKAIDFDGKWFNAVGANTYDKLNGNPIGFAFPDTTPGSIFSAATFYAPTANPNGLPDPTKQTTNSKQSIRLIGGTVINTGTIKTDGGNISIATVESGKYVQIKADGSIMRLELPTSANNIDGEPKSFTALSLPELLTATKTDLVATGVKNENGVLTLVGNPAANALVPDLDKAVAASKKATADYKKADADNQKAFTDYQKALAAVGSSALVDKEIINARNNAQSVYDNSLSIYNNSLTSLENIQKKFDDLAALAVFGEPSSISAAISRGDTVSKQNRPIVSGDIIVKNLDTSTRDVSGGNVHLDSSHAILAGNVNTRRNNSNGDTYVAGALNSYGGKVVLNAQTEIVAGIINSGTIPLKNPNDITSLAYLPTAGGAVILSTQTGDIIVESIFTGTSQSNESSLKDLTVRGGDLTVNAKGLFRVITNTDLVNTRVAESINSGPFGKIDIKHGGISFVTGADEKALEDVGGSQPQRKITEGFKFLDRESGARGFIITSRLGNGSYAVVYTNSRGFYDFQNKQSGAYGSTIQAVVPKIDIPVKNELDRDSNGGKKDTEVAKKTSGDKSGEQDPKDNSDNQASKPGDTEEEKQKAKKRKQKAKCSNNSSAIAAAKLGTEVNRAGNIANSAAEEFCPPNNSGILQILTDRK
jgi:filamentous hemagglutinin family protein